MADVFERINPLAALAHGVDFPQAADAVNDDPITVLKNTQNAELAQKWVDFVNGEQGRQVLTTAGFGAT